MDAQVKVHEILRSLSFTRPAPQMRQVDLQFCMFFPLLTLLVLQSLWDILGPVARMIIGEETPTNQPTKTEVFWRLMVITILLVLWSRDLG